MTVLRAGSATDVGQIRQINQDSHLIVASASLFGVADGMGGHQGGEVASAMAVEITESQATERSLESLMQAVRTANRAIFEKAGSDVELRGMGTTLVAVMLVDGPEGEEIAWVNVGDSRVYLLRDGELIQLSDDHSLVEDLVRDGQLTPDEARVHPQRNILTRALGIDLDVDVDGGTVLPFTGDRFLLCSDGLFNEVSLEQMSAVLRRLADPDEAAQELVRLANEGGGRDNITVVVVDVVDDGGRAAAASALLADQESKLDSGLPPTGDGDSDADGIDAGASTGTSAGHDGSTGPVFGGRRSSLPDSDDDYASDVEDPFAVLEKARTRRFTWRVGLFVLLLLAVVGVGVLAVGWAARGTYHAGFDDDQVALFRGKPGGLLWVEPELLDTTDIARADVPADMREALDSGVEYSSRDAAERYIERVRMRAGDEEAAASTTTTTTTVPATTTTSEPDATTTTVEGP